MTEDQIRRIVREELAGSLPLNESLITLKRTGEAEADIEQLYTAFDTLINLWLNNISDRLIESAKKSGA